MSLNISEEQYKRLQQILERENERTYTLDEIREIGDNLIELYELLIGDEISE